MLALLLFLLVPLASAQVVGNDGDPFITSSHAAGLHFYDNTTTNNTQAWASRLRAFGSVDVWIVGINKSYNLSFLDDNRTFAGVTVQNLTSIHVDINASSISPLLMIGNETHFFGVINVGSRPAVVDQPPLPLSILFIDYLAREFKTLAWAAFVMVGACVFLYFLLVRIKRGMISRW